MKQKIVLVIIVIMGLCMFTGCGRIINWGKSNFYQGEEAQQFDQDICYFLKSVTVYDQLATDAMFDVLWLSDEVRTAYAYAYALKRGKTVQQRNLFLRRQLEENNHFISFYTLTLNKIPLAQSDGPWHIFLEVNDQFYDPIEIKKVDLSEEYQSFFDKKYNRFKTAYLVKFDIKNIDDSKIIDHTTKSILLHFRSIDKHVTLLWEF